MYGQDMLCGISKVSFEIPHKIYIERCVVYWLVKIYEILHLRAPCIFEMPQWSIQFDLNTSYMCTSIEFGM